MADLAEELSDEEVFFGEMTLKEVKKHIWMNHGPVSRAKTPNKTSRKPARNSIKIIEAHSQPNLRGTSVNSPSPPWSARDNRKSDESFIQMENLVSKLCLSPAKAAELELNNTLEIVEFILNNGPDKDSKQPDIVNVKTEKDFEIDTTNMKKETEKNSEKICLGNPLAKISPKKEFALADISTPKAKIKSAVKSSPKYFTPAKSPRKQADIFLTPSSNMLEAKTPVFKTPANLRSLKKPSVVSLRTTPNKSPMYRNIKSPIATYIKGSIEVPMVTNVCPKKPLPGGSLIPKLVKKEPECKQNKENINLPTSAYKNAKTTKVVHMPDDEKPKNLVAKKLLSTLPQPPVILKHETRKFNSARKPLLHLQNDSIADQSCIQADLSVCTQIKPTNK